MSSSLPTTATTSPNNSNHNRNPTHHHAAVAVATAATPSYPMPAYLNFTPGGLSYCRPQESSASSHADRSYFYHLGAYCHPVTSASNNNSNSGVSTTPINSSLGTPRSSSSTNQRMTRTSPAKTSTGGGGGAGERPDVLIRNAKKADDLLHHISMTYYPHGGSTTGGNPTVDPPYRVPSLSVLANAAFGRLTGVPAAAAKLWADSMVLAYLHCPEATPETVMTEEQILASWLSSSSSTTPTASTVLGDNTAVNALKQLLQQAEAAQQLNPSGGGFRARPCGYVFKRGDIAWNCRTCQTDSTCVICDNCFKNSNHEGHEVFFHRTTPGGCCDCGDAEAWKLQGCCDAHRPEGDDVVESQGDDPDEAVRMAVKGRQQGIETLKNAPTALPPRFAAALGAVIGAAVNCLVQAVDGAGIGADPVQWKLRWMDEVSRIWNDAARNEDYGLDNEPKLPGSVVTPSAFVGTPAETLKSFPQNYGLHLRLHNDDVHTFDEVIDALHETRLSRRNQVNPDDPINQSLVTLREAANEMTHHVDADGQVTVKSFTSLHAAMQGFRRLKSRGLHCSVVSTAQTDMEHRARALSSWLSEISATHPAAAVLVVHALVKAGHARDLAGISVWQEARMIPAWAATEPLTTVPALRRRFMAFPPHLATSYLTSEEAEKLYDMATEINSQQFREMTGTLAMDLPFMLESNQPDAMFLTLNVSLSLQARHPVSTRAYHTDYLLKGIENRLMHFGARCPRCTSTIESRNTRSIPCCTAYKQGIMTLRHF